MTTPDVESQVVASYQKGVQHLYERGVSKVPDKYILPLQDRPNNVNVTLKNEARIAKSTNNNLKLPIIDFAELQSPNRRPQVLKSLANACEQYGFFQVYISRSFSEFEHNLNLFSR